VFVNFLGALALGPFLPAVAEELKVSVALLGQVPALMMLLAALLGLVIGPLADRFGYRRTLLLGLLAVLFSSLATGLAPSFPILITVTLVGAIGRAAILPVAQAIVGTRFADEDARRAALSQLQTGQSGASILGIPLLTSIAALLHWRAAFFALAVLALALAFALARRLERDEARSVGPTRLKDMLAPFAPLIRDRPSLALLLGAWLGNAALWVIVTYAAAFYVQRHGFTTQAVGWVYLICGLGVLLGQLLAGGRLGRRPGLLVIAGRAISGGLMGSALVLPLPALLTVALLTLAMLANGASNVATVALLSGVAPTGRATALTLNGSAMSLGTALGGSVGGLLLAVGGYPTLGAGSLVLALAAAGVVWWSRSREASRRTPVAASAG
jgi:predicted MFS family arabinose efflux permease